MARPLSDSLQWFRARARRRPDPQAAPGAKTLPETVDVQMPSVGGRSPARFRMYTWAGSDQIARDLCRFGWGGFEPPVPDVFARCVAANEGLVVDVGANTGFYSLVAAHASPVAEVHAFEPFPAALECLRQNLELNGDVAGRVIVHDQAVSDEVGDGVLHVPDPAHGLVETSCSLNGDFKERVVEQLSVPLVTLDAHLEALGRPAVGVIKIDVESLEHKVLAGAEAVLAGDRPIVFLEVLPSGDPAAIERARQRHDYVAVRLRVDSAIVGAPVSFDEKGWNQALFPAEKIGLLRDIVAQVPLRAVSAGTHA